MARFHGNERDLPYQCLECNKGFARVSTWEAHALSVHVNSRPYKCRFENCGTRFNLSGNRADHEKKLHKTVYKEAIPQPREFVPKYEDYINGRAHFSDFANITF